MITQGTFGVLPDLDDDEIEAQLRYAVGNQWAISIEFTDDPHPRNEFWELWSLPIFDVVDPRAVMGEINECRKAVPQHYVKVNAFDNTRGRETIALSFLVQRPALEPGFRVDRQTRPGRTLGYSLHAYAADRPHGERYE
jgi:ribulose-bisphosphate carboxylase small chain